MKTIPLSNETRYLSAAVDIIRAADGEDKPAKIRGYAAKFGMLSEFMYGVRERILPGAFDEVLGDDVRALINHEGVPLARTKSGTLALGVDEVGLWYEFTPPETEEARALITALERGDIDQSSFRFSITSKGYDYVEDEKDGTVREISKISRLSDVSIVTFPAYPDASAEMQRSLEAFQKSKRDTPEDGDETRGITPMHALNHALEKLSQLD